MCKLFCKQLTAIFTNANTKLLALIWTALNGRATVSHTIRKEDEEHTVAITGYNLPAKLSFAWANQSPIKKYLSTWEFLTS
jgi:hypothetical protein